MPGNGTIVVDTARMASSMDRITSAVSTTSNAVSKTTSAVVAMSQAVCLAETEAANAVCKKVTNGFHGLITAQLAQRKIECAAEVQSKFQVMAHFSLMLGKTEKQLNDDFQRISRRYGKIITSLNEALKKRIYDLDAPAAEVADQNFSMIMNRIMACGIPAILLDQETQPAANCTVVGHCKETCNKALDKLKRIADTFALLRENMRATICPRVISEVQQRKMPVVIMECEDLSLADFRRTSLTVGDAVYQSRLKNSITAAYEEKASQLNWKYDGSAANVIKNKVKQLMAKAKLDPRKQQLINNMLAEAKWQNLGEDK